jgi:hypothetical protein
MTIGLPRSMFNWMKTDLPGKWHHQPHVGPYFLCTHRMLLQSPQGGIITMQPSANLYLEAWRRTGTLVEIAQEAVKIGRLVEVGNS